MSNSILFLLITAAIFALIALWVPCLHFCHRCLRKVMRRREMLAVACVTLGMSLLAGCSDSGSPVAGPVTLRAASTLYVTNQPSGTNSTGQVLAFTATATGATTPSATLTLLPAFQVYAVATDSAGNIYVSGAAQPTTASSGGVVEVFAAGSTANSLPTRNISLGVNTFGFGITVDAAGSLYVATQNFNGANGTVSVYSSSASGTATPTRVISGANTGFYTNASLAVAVDGSGNIYVAPYAQAATTPGLVLVFSSTATGNVAPTRTISGASTGLAGTLIAQLAADSSGNVYVPAVAGSYPSLTSSVLVFGSAATGNVAPTRTISGLYLGSGIAVDGAGNVYVGGNSSSSAGNSVRVYSATASGAATPMATLTSTAWTQGFLDSIAVY